jgi:hypothetical protein
MATRGRRQPEDESVRINFRLNPKRSKERVILEFLRQHADNYDASRIIKQALYELATGRSWVTGERLTPTAKQQEDDWEASTGSAQDNDQMLNDILSGLEDWTKQ